jgi:tRNA (cmo5U34)-methyltransferase
MIGNATPYRTAEYDLNVRRTIPFYEVMHWEIIDLVKTTKPDVAWWLDTGCGTGYLVELALTEFPQTHFILADPSETMLEQARKRLEGVGDTRLRFLDPVGSAALEGQIGDATPQVITAVQCHHYLRPAERCRAVQACYDALEDRGLFVTVENIAPWTEQGTRIVLERWKRYQMHMGRSEKVVDDHLTRFGTKYFPVTVDEHIRLMTEAGFQAVELFWLSQLQAGFYGIK